MHENMKTSMWHTGRSERTCRLPACFFCTDCFYSVALLLMLHDKERIFYVIPGYHSTSKPKIDMQVENDWHILSFSL